MDEGVMQLEEQARDRKALFGVNLLYLISMMLFVSIGYITQKWSFYYGVLTTEFLLIALPAVIYIKMKGESLRTVLRINGLAFVDTLLVIVIFLSGYPVALFLNLLWDVALSLFGQLIVPDIPVAQSWKEYFILLLVIAGSAGLCEEVLFRGLLLKTYERLGEWPGILFTAVLFAAMHLNIQNILAPMFLGVLLGYVVRKTDSILAGMLGHFLNNAISVTIGFAVTSLPFYRSASQEELRAGLQTAPLLGAVIFAGFFALVFGTVMVLCMKALSDRHSRNDEDRDTADAGAGLSVSRVLKDFKSTWPLYAGLAIFAGMLLMQVLYIVQGKNVLH